MGQHDQAMQRVVLVLLMSLVLAACGGDGTDLRVQVAVQGTQIAAQATQIAAAQANPTAVLPTATAHARAQSSSPGYAEALRRIAAAGDGSATTCVSRETTIPSCLGLDKLGLTQLPPEIGQLSNLQELTLGCNQLTTLPPEIGQLTKLRELWLMRNPLDAASRALVQRLQERGVGVFGP